MHGSEVQIDLIRQCPPVLACAQALVPFEETVLVNIAGLGPGRYEVVVQDVRTTLELPIMDRASGHCDTEALP